MHPPVETRKETSPLIYMPGQAEVPKTPREHPGRKSRTTAAGWVLDYLVPRNGTILLCAGCNHKFDGRKVNYVSLHRRFGWVMGNCDGCKAPHTRNFMWVSESLLGTTSGKVWDPKYI